MLSFDRTANLKLRFKRLPQRVSRRPIGQLLKELRLWIPFNHKTLEPPAKSLPSSRWPVELFGRRLPPKATRSARRPLSNLDNTVPSGMLSDWAVSRQVKPSKKTIRKVCRMIGE